LNWEEIAERTLENLRSHDSRRLVTIEIQIPDGADEEFVRDRLIRIYEAADEIYQAAGGEGLVEQDVTILDEKKAL
jgi:small-conductance mechanosensitive channel